MYMAGASSGITFSALEKNISIFLRKRAWFFALAERVEAVRGSQITLLGSTVFATGNPRGDFAIYDDQPQEFYRVAFAVAGCFGGGG
jgi:hypothetical protein